MAKNTGKNHLNDDNSSLSPVTKFAKGMKVYNPMYTNVFRDKKPSEPKKTKR